MRAGVDIGGTFTDLCIAGPDGIVAIGKALGTPATPAQSVENVIRDAPDHELSQVVHATTLVTNALIERKGAKVALLATHGFRDVMELARERRPDIYRLDVWRPEPLVPRHLRFDVKERTFADGTIEQEVDEAEIEALARELTERGIEAIAVCFLHSFANATNEQAARAAVQRAAPDLRVAISSDVAPEIREYERTQTTAASVYVQDRVVRYLEDLEERLTSLGAPGRLRVMLSNGGVATAQDAADRPIRMLESGPAAGALAAARFAGLNGYKDLMSFDMGGTTAKLCLIEDGRPLVTHELEAARTDRFTRGSGLPIKTPTIDMIEIGVGGGSLAGVDTLGLLTCGPESAGADPGPACYGGGGTLPTVTDADLVLGYLDPDFFLGGDMSLDVEAAREAIREHIAEPLGLGVEAAAWGIHRLVNEDMASAARVHAAERGHDATGLPLFAFGGAGPVHAAGVAGALGTKTLIVPAAAGVMSAVGVLAAPLAADAVRSRLEPVDEDTLQRVEPLLQELEAQNAEILGHSGVTDITHERSIDMRYVGQGFEVTVPVEPDSDLKEAFEAAYVRSHGRKGPDVPIEAISWRVLTRGPDPDLKLKAAPTGDGDAQKGTREVWFEDAYVETPIYDRYRMAVGERIDGPAIVEERESTTVVGPGATARVAEDGSLILETSVLLSRRETEPQGELPPKRASAQRESRGLDPVTVGIAAGRLASILDEQQATLVRTAFSTIVRESEDLACGVFDRAGRMLGQSHSGTPGHINAMATGIKHVVEAYPPDTLHPGDVLVTNDPWMTAGQINDLTVVTPVFRGERMIGLFASTCHAPDIGGRLLSAEASDVYEEGLRLPILKLARKGEMNEDLLTLIRANVRTPRETVGDLYAQMAANDVGARSLLRCLDDLELEDLEEVGAEIRRRSESAMRAAISKLPDGRYEATGYSDGFGERVTLQLAAIIDGDEITLDFAGSSPQSEHGINVVLNYTHAYASFALKAAVAPGVPHNDGSFTPVHVTAPEGSILNCREPAPVASRHAVGHFLPGVVLAALAPVLERHAAGSADALWISVWSPFNLTLFQCGGAGAWSGRDGRNSSGFPSAVASVPTEVFELAAPVVQRERSLRPDSGGAGQWRGGLGQTSIMTLNAGEPEWRVSALADRTTVPAPGADGGRDGATGEVSVDGEPLPTKRLTSLQRDAHVRLDLPGGGGVGDPRGRDPQAVLADVVDGYITIAAAKELYGVTIRQLRDSRVLLPEDFEIEEEA